MVVHSLNPQLLDSCSLTILPSHTSQCKLFPKHHDEVFNSFSPAQDYLHVILGLPKFSSVRFSAIFSDLQTELFTNFAEPNWRTKLNGSELVHSLFSSVQFSVWNWVESADFFFLVPCTVSSLSIKSELFLVLHEKSASARASIKWDICRHVWGSALSQTGMDPYGFTAEYLWCHCLKMIFWRPHESLGWPDNPMQVMTVLGYCFEQDWNWDWSSEHVCAIAYVSNSTVFTWLYWSCQSRPEEAGTDAVNHAHQPTSIWRVGHQWQLSTGLFGSLGPRPKLRRTYNKYLRMFPDGLMGQSWWHVGCICY